MTDKTRESLRALLANGDASWWQRLKAWRKADAEEVSLDHEFQQIRRQLPQFRDLPPYFAWDELSREMKANILVGAEAGDVVKSAPPLRVIGWKAGLAMGSLTMLMIVGYWWQLPRHLAGVAAPTQAVLQASPGQLAVYQQDKGFSIVFEETGSSLELGGASGSMRADYVDQETGQLTVAHVYLD